MKVAIVGSGVAGLTASWLLNRAGHDVTLLERHSNAGLDTHSVNISVNGTGVDNATATGGPDANQKPFRADVPLRMLNRSLWPTLFRLYETIGVELESVESSKTFAEYGGKSKLILGESWVSQPLRFLWQRDARRIVKDIRRMMAEAQDDLEDPQIGTLQFSNYLCQRNYSDAFIYKFLFPSLASTVCTCSYESLKRYPTGIMLRTMMMLTNREPLYRVRNGSADVASRLSLHLDDIQFDAGVRSVTSSESCVRIELENGATVAADHLIIATQANSAAKILGSATATEKAMLNCFKYEDIEVVVHRDESLMPTRRSDWSNFNLIFEKSKQSAMCSVWLNRYYPEWQTENPTFQTIMPLVEVSDEKVVCRRRLQRPVVDHQSLQGLKLLDQLHQERERRIWFCGSYASPGVPLLESGVVSAMSVVNAMQVGETVPR